MALITCKNCGKKISDTVEKCIHCGATTKEPDVKETSISKEQNSEANEAGKTVFNKLSEKEQIKLENEFLKFDKKARIYRRKIFEAKRFALLVFLIPLITRVLSAGQKGAIEKLFEGKIYDPKMLDLSEKCLIPLIAVLLMSIVLCIYSATTYKKRENKQLYAKKFQRWLKEEKNIVYKPNFISEKDRVVFEEINLDTTNF